MIVFALFCIEMNDSKCIIIRGCTDCEVLLIIEQ